MSLAIGVDEVGRGPLAGPVVACACHLPLDFSPTWLTELTDSKVLSAGKRERLAALLQAVPHAIAAASVAEIDTLNIRNASLLAMRRAVERVAAQLPAGCQVIVDGNVQIPQLTLPQQAIIKADATVPCVSAASILAKVYRDKLMQDLHAQHPHYGWASNAGYGSAAHVAALQMHGATVHHRQSFAPVKAVLESTRHAA